MKASGAPGYKYIMVEEDEAANVLYCNGTLLHLSSDQIPKGFAVSVGGRWWADRHRQIDTQTDIIP